MSQFSLKIFAAFLVVFLAACSSGSSKEINYRDSEITPTLEIPPDLISRSTDNNLALPGSNIGTPSKTGRYVETGNLNVEVRTLPAFDTMKIEGQGDLHWLMIDLEAERVYPQIRDFWAEQGFRLVVDEPAVGIMETEWLSMKSGSDSFFSSLLASFRAAESKDQYKTRFERSADGLKTLIFIAHRGQEQVIFDEDATLFSTRDQGWQMSPSDPSKEYEMLSRMMIFLGMQDEQVKQELEKIGLFAARAKIQIDEDDDESLSFLQVNQGFVQTWNRLKHQLDRLNIPLSDIDKDNNEGSMKLTVDGRLIPDSELNEFAIALEGSTVSNTTRIDVLNDSGAINHSPEAKRLLQFLLQQLK